MFLRHSIERPAGPLTVYIDDRALREDKGRIDALGELPFNPNGKVMRASFSPPLNEHDKAGPFSADAIAQTMGMGGLAMRWATVPSVEYDKPDVPVVDISWEEGTWSGPLVEKLLTALEKNAESS